MELEGKSPRDIEQDIVIDRIAKQGYRGTFIAGTGFGKSRVIVKMMLKMVKSIKVKKFLILVPTDVLKERFRDEFSKVLGEEEGKKFVDKYIDLQCYASISKLDPLDYTRVFGDEIHLGLTERCGEFYNKCRKSGVKMIFCTATTPEDGKHRMLMSNMAPVEYKITLDQCVERGFVSSYMIECIGVNLMPVEEKMYSTVNNNFAYWKGKLVRSAEDSDDNLGGLLAAPANSFVDAFAEANRIVRCKIRGKYTKEDYAAADGFFRAIRQRKELVDHAHNKIKIAKLFAEKTVEGGGKVLVFGGDNDFTDKIAANIPDSVVYHSNIGLKLKRQALKEFRTGEANVLCSTKALNQGLDVPDADTGVICGLTSKVNTMIQRTGRLIRVDPNNPKKCGVIKVIYVKDSQEEKWLRNALKTTSKKRIKWTDGKKFLKTMMA